MGKNSPSLKKSPFSNHAEKKMPYYWRHFFLSFNLSNVHTAADRCYHHTQPRRRLRICHSVRSGFNVIHTKETCLFKLLCLPKFGIEDCLQSIWLLSCYKLIDWLIRPLWSCAYGSENCPEEWSNSGQQRQLQIAKECCSDCTQGINFVAPRRRFFLLPKEAVVRVLWLPCNLMWGTGNKEMLLPPRRIGIPGN